MTHCPVVSRAGDRRQILATVKHLTQLAAQQLIHYALLHIDQHCSRLERPNLPRPIAHWQASWPADSTVRVYVAKEAAQRCIIGPTWIARGVLAKSKVPETTTNLVATLAHLHDDRLSHCATSLNELTQDLVGHEVRFVIAAFAAYGSGEQRMTRFEAELASKSVGIESIVLSENKHSSRRPTPRVELGYLSARVWRGLCSFGPRQSSVKKPFNAYYKYS
eukprot:scpid50671/ scgid23128/ 